MHHLRDLAGVLLELSKFYNNFSKTWRIQKRHKIYKLKAIRKDNSSTNKPVDESKIIIKTKMIQTKLSKKLKIRLINKNIKTLSRIN
jgi:hypothetical protein